MSGAFGHHMIDSHLVQRFLSNSDVLKLLLTGLRAPYPFENKVVDFQMGLGSDSKQI